MSKTSGTRGLGRGFDALIPTALDTAALLNQGERIQNLLISEIVANKDQPRTTFDESALKELAASIKRHGILQPIVVTPYEQNKYTIVAGERRWRAAAIAGLDRIPAIVRTIAALEQLEIALIENVQRVDLAPLEQAISIERLHQQFNMTYVIIAERLGKAPTTVNNIVRLLNLPIEARNALQAEKITEGHARSILSLKDLPTKQDELLRNILEHHWSVRQAEQFVIAHKRDDKKTGQAVRKHMAIRTPETERLSKKLKTSITLRRTAKGGLIEISFKNDEDLKRLLDSF